MRINEDYSDKYIHAKTFLHWNTLFVPESQDSRNTAYLRLQARQAYLHPRLSIDNVVNRSGDVHYSVLGSGRASGSARRGS